MADKLFTKPIKKQFEFDSEVAAVFDDMLKRSVPFYEASQGITLFFVLKYLEDGTRLYDLGCSTATLLLQLHKRLACGAKLIGIDNSRAMLEQAQKKCNALGADIFLEYGDILSYPYEEASVFVSNYTLQFVRPLVREKLITKIYQALRVGGVFIFSEKVISPHAKIDKELIECYYKFKKEQGYSEYEIAQKREALENVLVPYTQEENIKMVLACGFSHCEVIFRWGNFATFLAIKE